MNKTDIVFYLSVLGIAWTQVSSQVKPLVSGNLFAWLSVAFTVIAVVSYALYEKLNGQPPVPPAPQA